MKIVDLTNEIVDLSDADLKAISGSGAKNGKGAILVKIPGNHSVTTPSGRVNVNPNFKLGIEQD